MGSVALDEILLELFDPEADTNGIYDKVRQEFETDG